MATVRRGAATALIALLATLSITLTLTTGCATSSSASPSQALLGTWFEDRTGAEYQFVSDSLLVVPHAQPGGGNAVTYRLLGGNQLDVVANGAHHVSQIAELTPASLALADPLTGGRQIFYREPTRTAFARGLEQGALAHARAMATLAADPSIVWVAARPRGKSGVWGAWPTSTMDTYGSAWDWSAVHTSTVPATAAGGGDAIAYSFTLRRTVPSQDYLAGLVVGDSVEPTAGAPKIDVGYSATMVPYAAGTLVYLPKGLVYSLGDGYAIAVGVAPKAKGFYPLTHQ